VLHDIVGDVRTAMRQLRRTPGFALGAVAVLSLGIGLNAAVFGVFHALVFAGRPFADPSQLVQLYSRHSKEPDSYRPFSYGAYEIANARRDAFAGVAAHRLDMVGVREPSGGDPRRTFAAFVSGNYLEVLGIPIVRGRGFTPDEARAGSQAPVAIASHVYWQRTGRDPNIIGRTVTVNERPVTIVGVTPPGFTGTMMVFGPELFLPLGLHDVLGSDLTREGGEGRRTLADPSAFDLYLVGRLARGLTVESATPRLPATAAAMADAYPAQYGEQELSIAPLPRFGTSTSPMNESALSLVAAVFIGMTSAVLLIVCLNLASVVVARGQARRREFAIRLALGSGRLRIIRQLMTEALVLGTLGALGGVMIGLPAIEALLTTLLSRLPVSLAVDAGTTTGTLIGGFTFGIAAAVMFALGPALRQSRDGGFGELKHQLGEEARAKRRWLKYPLVTAQVALSLGLLVAAGLLVRFAREGIAVEVGVDADETLLIDIDAALAGVDETRGLAMYAAVEERLRALPDVEAASLGATVPFGSVRYGEAVRRAGTRPAAGSKPATPEEGRSFGATANAVGAEYFEAMGLRILRGRAFTDVEARQAGAPRVAIVNDVLARRLWPDGDAVGQMVHLGDDPPAGSGRNPANVEIVGVVSTLNDSLFAKEPGRNIYVPFAQQYRSGAYLHVRPRSGTGEGFAGRVRAAIRDAAPTLPVFGATTFGAHLRSSVEFWGLKALASMAMGVGLFAAVIALIGVYGSKAYAVSRRAREIGIRLAVGASPAGVRAMVLGEALEAGAIGVVVGSAIGLGVGRALAAVFVDLAGFDIWIATLTPLLLLGACGAAAWVPARRASRLNPANLLRAE